MMETLVPIYGEAFLRYVLDIEDSADFPSVQLNPQQLGVVQVLQQFASPAPSASDPQGMERFAQLSQLGQWQEQSGSSIANALRVHAGGTLPVAPHHDEPLMQALLAVARDVWPSLLIPPPNVGMAPFWNSTPLGVFAHPMTIDAAKAFLRDEGLRKLFPGGPTGDAIESLDLGGMIQVTSQWMGSAGRGGTVQLASLIGFVISNAHLRCLAEDGEASWESLCTSMSETVSVLRRLAAGDTVEVPKLIAFVGLKLPEGESLVLPHGTFRAPRQIDRDYLLNDSGSATCVLQTTFPLHLREIRAWSPGETLGVTGWEDIRANYLKAQREIDLTRLSVLLSSPSDDFWSLTEVASLIVDPTTPGGASQWSSQRYNSSIAELDTEGKDRIGSWYSLVKTKHPAQLDIAMRRTLTAAGNRLDPMDGFVDAVVAWENCFGTSTETTFRVTAALAALLEPTSATARIRKQKELKKIYDKRSRVVHGAIDLSPDDATKLRDSALRTAIECLKHLYSDRPELLAAKPEERSALILLGEWTGTSEN
jgi:hypothetical protein